MEVSSWVGNRELVPPEPSAGLLKLLGASTATTCPGDTHWTQLSPSKPERYTLPFPLQPFPYPNPAFLTVRIPSLPGSWLGRRPTLNGLQQLGTSKLSDCLITCSRPFAGLARLMGKKMHCFQPRQKLDCHACPGACALHYNVSSRGTRWGWRAAARAGHPTCHGVKLRQSCCLSGPSSTSHACFS